MHLEHFSLFLHIHTITLCLFVAEFGNPTKQYCIIVLTPGTILITIQIMNFYFLVHLGCKFNAHFNERNGAI